MPTKVLDVEFGNIPEVITGLEGYARAMVLVRIGGRPVERLFVPVQQGKIQGGNLRSAIAKEAGGAFWEYWLANILSYPIEKEREYQIFPATIAVCTRDRAEDLEHCL